MMVFDRCKNLVVPGVYRIHIVKNFLGGEMMKGKKTTRRALVMSLLSLLLCCSMLVGTTFAWFTDSVTSGQNKIIAGNLDVDVYYGDPAAKNSIDDVNTLFNDVTLWEPGAVAWENLTVVNLGTLALKYQLSVNFADQNYVEGTNAKLSEALKVAVIEGGIDETLKREQVLTAAGEGTPLASFTESGKLLPKDSTLVVEDAVKEAKTYGIVIWWEPSAEDNKWNVQNGAKTSDGEPLQIDLGINLVATQLEAEDDSFGSDYDAGAPWTGGVNTDWYFKDPAAAKFYISTAEELAGFAAIVNGTATAPVTTLAATAPTPVQDTFKGKIVYLDADIDLNNAVWTPIGQPATSTTDFTTSFSGTFDGQKHTVANLHVNNGGFSGLFGLAYGATIKNVKIAGVDIRSNRMAGSVVGQLYGSLDNCHATNVSIRVVPNAVGNTYDNGDKVGGIVGWIGDNGNNRTLTGCSVETAELSAYRDVGGIAGYVAYSTTVSDNSVTGATIVVDQQTNYYGDKDPNAGEIWGRNSVSNSGVGVEASNNTATEVTINATYLKNGLVLFSDGKKVALHSVPATYEDDTVTVPQEVTALANGAFAYNSNVKKVIIPATVTDFGGTPNESGTGASGSAFKKSAVETVELEEGITEIPAAAFNQAGKLKSLNIPASVTTIGINALAYSGLETLTVPATVTSIGYGAFRGMPELTTATIEGDEVYIPDYAFRGCPKLTTVNLKVKELTLGANMIFTNTDTNNEDPNNITIYVENEAVEAVLKNNANVKCNVVIRTTSVANAAELTEAAANGGRIKLTEDVTLTAPIEVSKNAVIDLNDKTISGTSKTLVKVEGGNVTLKNGTIKNVKASATDTNYSVFLSGDAVATIEDVKIETTGVGIYADEDAKIEKLDAEVKSYMNANGYCCYDAVTLEGNARIEEITGGTYESYYAPEYIEWWNTTHSYSGIMSYPINLNSPNAYIGKISGGTFLGVMDKANNGTPIHVNSGTIGEISGGYFGFAKTGLTAPDRLIYVNTANGGKIEKITGGTFEKGDWNPGFSCDFETIVANSGCEVQNTGNTVNVDIQFSTKVTTYTLAVLEVVAKP